MKFKLSVDTRKRIKFCIISGIYALPFLISNSFGADFDLTKIKEVLFVGPAQFIIDIWPWALIMAGGMGALATQGDLKAKMMNTGYGIAAGGLVLAAAKLGLGITTSA